MAFVAHATIHFDAAFIFPHEFKDKLHEVCDTHEIFFKMSWLFLFSIHLETNGSHQDSLTNGHVALKKYFLLF
ncbi:hypothetical protein HMPREF1640_09710 [Prevotella sp. S7-1-8]|nr:hypothetical protein HMPREF1640_09710 [Prevotella sp. S7-1-8]